MDWTGYVPFDPGVVGPLRDAPRELAEDHFARLMAARPERRAQLAALWSRDRGGSLDDAAVADVSTWLAAALDAAGPDALTGGDADRWSGLVADVALWLGERAIAAAPALRWEMLTLPKKATGYQRPVLVGFTRVAERGYYCDVAHLVASWAQLAARRRPQLRRDFLATIEQTMLGDA